MVPLGILKHFLKQGSRCVRMFETHPLLIQLLPHPCLDFGSFTYIMAFQNDSLLPNTRSAFGKCVRGPWASARFKRSISVWECQYFITMLYFLRWSPWTSWGSPPLAWSPTTWSPSGNHTKHFFPNGPQISKNIWVLVFLFSYNGTWKRRTYWFHF